MSVYMCRYIYVYIYICKCICTCICILYVLYIHIYSSKIPTWICIPHASYFFEPLTTVDQTSSIRS